MNEKDVALLLRCVALIAAGASVAGAVAGPYPAEAVVERARLFEAYLNEEAR